MSTKRTLQPSKGRRIKRLGFRRRNSTAQGRKIFKKRRQVGRKKVVIALKSA